MYVTDERCNFVVEDRFALNCNLNSMLVFRKNMETRRVMEKDVMTPVIYSIRLKSFCTTESGCTNNGLEHLDAALGHSCLKSYGLCILTSKWVLCTLVAGQNHLFGRRFNCIKSSSFQFF